MWRIQKCDLNFKVLWTLDEDCSRTGLLSLVDIRWCSPLSLHKVKTKQNQFVCNVSPQTQKPFYIVIYEGQLTPCHPHVPASHQRIFDQQVPLTRTKHKASWYTELWHTQKITDRKPFSILYRCVHMFDQALCLLIWSVTVYGSVCSHSIISPQ